MKKRVSGASKTQQVVSGQSNERPARQQRNTRNPRTSADREAAFIDLVEKS